MADFDTFDTPGLNSNYGFRPMGSGPVLGGGGGGGGGSSWDPFELEKMKLQRDLAAQQQAGENYRAQIGANAQTYPAQLKQQRFQQIWPWVQGQWTGQGQGALPPAAGVAAPPINTSNPWDPQRTQQNINAARAFGDQATQSKINAMEQETAGRGFGANSPLASMLRAQYQAAGMANNANQAREIQNTAASENAKQQLGVNQLQENRRAAQAQEQLTGRGQDVQARNAWISALSGFFS